MLQAGVAVIEGEAPVESLVDVHLGAGKAEAARLLRDLEAAAFPLHDIVIANDAFVHQAADALKTFRATRQAVAASRGGRAKRRL